MYGRITWRSMIVVREIRYARIPNPEANKAYVVKRSYFKQCMLLGFHSDYRSRVWKIFAQAAKTTTFIWYPDEWAKLLS